MTKRPKKSDKPLAQDLNFDEALGRFAHDKPADGKVAEKSDLVPLVEDDTGHRCLIYSTAKEMRVDLRFEGATFWASQAQMAEMFGIDRTVVGRHIRNVLSDGELVEEGNVHSVHKSTTKPTKLYSLNVMISVGYRTESKLGTMFRIWATDKLFQILTKGFYIDKERMKNQGEPDALDEFKEIAAEIRGSIRNSYREVLRLCTLCSDYDGSSQSARTFFMDMENKLLFAATDQKTGPQLILERCDAAKEDVGLTYFAGKRGPTKRDVVVANNYLAQSEARTKNRITVMWLTYVEEQLAQGRLPTMAAVAEKLVGFIKFNQWALLTTRGRHSREDADRHALGQLETFRQQKIE